MVNSFDMISIYGVSSVCSLTVTVLTVCVFSIQVFNVTASSFKVFVWVSVPSCTYAF